MGVHAGRIERLSATTCGIDIANRMVGICSVTKFFVQPLSRLGDAGVRFGYTSGHHLVDMRHSFLNLQDDIDADPPRQRSESLDVVPQCLVTAAGQEDRRKPGRI